MGLLNAMVQNEGMNRGLPAYARESVAGLRESIDKGRLSKIGNAFNSWPDKSAQGIQKFAQKHKLSFPETQSLVHLVAQFNKDQRTISGPDVKMYKQIPGVGIAQRDDVRPREMAKQIADEWKRGTLKQTTTTKPQYDMQTVYGPNGLTERVSIQKGSKYTPPKGWSLDEPSKKKGETLNNQSRLYINSMNQILKEHGGSGSDFSFDKATGEFSFSTGGGKAYEDMYKKASEGDMKAKRNLTTYQRLKQQLLKLTGVDFSEASSGSSWRDYQ